MRIVGIDPGTQRCGFAVLEMHASQSVICEIGYWNLLGKSSLRPPLGERLELLHNNVGALFSKWNPALIGLEKAVAFRNVDSALKLSESRGIVRLAAHQKLENASDRLLEISPTAVKKHTAGWGLSGKTSIMRVLGLRFAGLNEAVGGRDLTNDAFDALAIAWTAWVLSRGRSQTKKTLDGIQHRP